MALLLAQLGDIHFTGVSDPAANLSESIGATIAAEITPTTSLIVLALCGDIAFSGTQPQYRIAKQFIEAIETAIRERREDIGIIRVVVPGNHDCDFRGDPQPRKTALESTRDGEVPSPPNLKVILDPLSACFDFARDVAGEHASITEANPFYTSLDVEDYESTVRLHLLNTAWMSARHEEPGSLSFPLNTIAPPPQRVECSIAILHHPMNWQSQPHSMRPLRDRLEQLASIVLVNHEHCSEAIEQVKLFASDEGNGRTLYVSGGVIQERGQPDLCTFNILSLETESQSVSIARYTLQRAVPNTFFKCTARETASLSGNTLSTGPAGVSLQPQWREFLDDPGAPITHPLRDPRSPIRLTDIFLFPDLWELDDDHKGGDQKQIRSATVADEVLSTHRTLITGGEKSGRTAIAKKLFLSAFEEGRIPVYLRGTDFPKQPERLREFFRDAVKKQYQNLSPDAFEQRPPRERVVLIDDVHRMALGTGARQKLLQVIERSFGTVVLCGDDLIKLDELNGRNARDSGLWDYRHLMILEFGETLREQFVRKWTLLGVDLERDEDRLQSEVKRICSLLNVIIKTQLLPSYPLFLLVVLQQSDLATASVQRGSFGKLFEGVMTAILVRSQFNPITTGDKYHYLAALAKRMYDGRDMHLSIDETKQWHRRYWDNIEIDIDFDRLSKDLATVGILTINDTEVRFKYSYFFCFFVAYHLNRTVHVAETRQLISQLSRQLHHRVSADIVLFLAHLTGDPIVLDEMARTCDHLFAEGNAASLDEDVRPLNHLGDVIDTIAIPDSPDENRREIMMRNDAVVSERLAATKSSQDVAPPEADTEALRRLFEINAAYKTIEILGQALRNISGSASKQRKEEIIEKIIGLARRVLGAYLGLIDEESLPGILNDIASVHMEQQPELAQSDLYDSVCRHLTGLSQFVCFSIIRHTTFSVGSENLAPTIYRVLGRSHETVLKLFGLSFDLERQRAFPRDSAINLHKSLNKNGFSASIVRILIAHHMYLYVVPYNDRQAVCEKMSIKLLPSVMDRNRKRLTN